MPARAPSQWPSFLRLALPLIALAACKDAAPPKAEVQLATDLPAVTVDVVLKAVQARGAPPAERIAGLGLGASALAAEGARHVAEPDAGTADAGPARAGHAADAGLHARAADGGIDEPPPQRPGVTEPAATAALPDGGVAAAPPKPTGAGPLAAPNVGGDIRWDLEPYGAIIAAQRGELLPMPAAAADVPDLWRDPSGTWVAVGGRARVLLVNKALRAAPGPSRLATLTDPSLKGKVALAAPTGGAALAHFAALYTAWGEARMRAWLKAVKDNGAQILPTDDDVRLAVVQGRAVVGLIGSDEAAKAAAIANVAVVYPDQRTIGTFVWPTALSRPRNARHPEAAALLAEALADKATEQLLVAREPGFIPLRPGIPVPTGVRSAWNLRVVSVEPAQIVADIEARRPELEAWAKAK